MINESTGSVGSTPTSTALWPGPLKQGAPCAFVLIYKKRGIMTIWMQKIC